MSSQACSGSPRSESNFAGSTRPKPSDIQSTALSNAVLPVTWPGIKSATFRKHAVSVQVLNFRIGQNCCLIGWRDMMSTRVQVQALFGLINFRSRYVFRMPGLFEHELRPFSHFYHLLLFKPKRFLRTSLPLPRSFNSIESSPRNFTMQPVMTWRCHVRKLSFFAKIWLPECNSNVVQQPLLEESTQSSNGRPQIKETHRWNHKGFTNHVSTSKEVVLTTERVPGAYSKKNENSLKQVLHLDALVPLATLTQNPTIVSKVTPRCQGLCANNTQSRHPILHSHKETLCVLIIPWLCKDANFPDLLNWLRVRCGLFDSCHEPIQFFCSLQWQFHVVSAKEMTLCTSLDRHKVRCSYAANTMTTSENSSGAKWGTGGQPWDWGEQQACLSSPGQITAGHDTTRQ